MTRADRAWQCECTCLNRRWKRLRGSMFQAMLSVMAVKIQLSSPRGVFRSVCFPGILSMSSFVKPSAFRSDLEQNHLRATCACHVSTLWSHTDARAATAFVRSCQ